MESVRGAGITDSLSLLLAKRGLLTDARLRGALGVTKLSPRHVTVLAHLEPEPTCQQQLVELLEVDPSVLVAILNDLESADLLRRRRDPTDRRRHIVELTAAGGEALATTAKVLAEVEDELFSDLSAAERGLLGELLRRVVPRSGQCQARALSAAQPGVDLPDEVHAR
ncbi:winged helix-turn-helix transcriptional regulator [Natronosporangium hydrolyticum]|uniref:Winged helix-turn-helix transcriptional regulator n=1 Tax=Natronosporangium hydrolyticum TaxID=2811111 RepID=A0A895YIX7_9ACTN|nr:MarR family winged helix-turn-helix transcriptional regulator [Natronosporangium hydrolyticum]QSB15945.1 winged helix-turn-helix transcriptional regulator [Natronosporangium hydrolyticum]